LEQDTYLIGTLRSNRAGSGHEVVQKKLKLGEAYGLQNKTGIKLIKWTDKRDFSADIHKTVAFSDYGEHRKN